MSKEIWNERICKSENHYCAQCGKKILYNNREWELKYWTGSYPHGYPNSEYYHPRCCEDENTSDEA